MSLRPTSFHEASSAAEGPSFGLGGAWACPTAGDSNKPATIAISKNLLTSAPLFLFVDTLEIHYNELGHGRVTSVPESRVLAEANKRLNGRATRLSSNPGIYATYRLTTLDQVPRDGQEQRTG